MTSKALGNIIKICGESGVSEIKFGDLSVSFNKIKEIQNAPQVTLLDQVEKINPKIEVREKDFVELDEITHKEEKLANMLLESPQEYEDALLREDLIDLGDDLDDEKIRWS